jgi:Uma2 family endonuclease
MDQIVGVGEWGRVAVAEGNPHAEGMTDARSRRDALYAELEKLPPNSVGEIVGGKLHVSPRPANPHARVSSRLGIMLGGPFDLGQGGPGGWIILDEPELHLAEDVLVPDVAGWRRERMPELPQGVGFTLAPDWVCEVLSPSTVALDRTRKMAVYAREGVRHLWLLDPVPQTLEVYRLVEGSWRVRGTHAGAARVRVEPFEALELELGRLWER